MKKLLIAIIAIFLMCCESSAYTLRGTNYWHDYSSELEYAIKYAAQSGEPLYLQGFIRIKRPIHYWTSSPYESITIYGDSAASSVLYFDFDTQDTAFLLGSGTETKVPVVLKAFAIRRLNDWSPNGGKNLLLSKVADFLIHGLSITGSNGFSLSIQEGELGRIVHNYVGWTSRGSGSDGIHIEAPGSDIVISDNTLVGCGDDSISVGSHIDGAYVNNIIIDSNTVWSGDRGGIKVHEGAQNVKVSNNIVHGVALHCIGVTTENYADSEISKIAIQNNMLYDCGTHGVFVDANSSRINTVIIDNNTISRTNNSAIRNDGGTDIIIGTNWLR